MRVSARIDRLFVCIDLDESVTIPVHYYIVEVEVVAKVRIIR